MRAIPPAAGSTVAPRQCSKELRLGHPYLVFVAWPVLALGAQAWCRRAGAARHSRESGIRSTPEA